MMTFRYVRYCTLPEVQNFWWNKAGGDNRSENGCGTLVALSANHIHTDTDSAATQVTRTPGNDTQAVSVSLLCTSLRFYVKVWCCSNLFSVVLCVTWIFFII
jgi:hypothetical protein